MVHIDSKQARAIATIAYIFAFPLVMRYRQLHRQAIDPSSPVYSGGFGTWRERHATRPRTGGSGRPFEDVTESSAWLDLRTEPWWCAVDDPSSDVVFTGRIVDLWGFTVIELDIAHPGPILAAAPMRLRNVPPEIRGVARGESSVVQLTTEVRWSDPYRLPGTPPARPHVVLEPVSAHVGRPAPGRTAAPWAPWFEGIETTDEFWSCVNFALTLTAAHHDDRHILEEISRIGVVPGEPWTAAAFPRDVADGIRDGMNDALSDLMAASAEPGAGLVRRSLRSELDRDYFGRALAALHPNFGIAS